jgi:hypothetical protein
MFSDYLVFIDESGDHVLEVKDADYPVFVLAACIIKKDEYLYKLQPALTDMKLKYYGKDCVIFHEREIRKKAGAFSILKNQDIMKDFMADMNNMMAAIDYTVISTVIDKGALKATYKYPEHPYNLACRFCLERIFLFLEKKAAVDKKTIINFESRGEKEDKELKLHFLEICTEKGWTNFDINFINKSTNCSGLQFSDLIARPIGRWVINREQQNRAFDILKSKFYKKGDDFLRIGLKIFP